MTYDSMISTVGSLLRQRRWLLPVPAELLPAYKAQRLEEFDRLATMAWPLLILMYVGLNAFTYMLYSRQMSPGDLNITLVSEGVSIMIIAGGVRLALTPATKPSYNTWIPVCAAMIIAAKILAGLHFEQQTLFMNEIHVTSLVIIVSTLALRLTTLAAAATCVMGMVAFSAAIHIPDYMHSFTFFAYYTLTSLTCLFVAALREDKDRIAFMQAIQLEQKKSEVDRLNSELTALAQRDSLTGLFNRRHFDATLLKEWERSRRTSAPLALVLVDVDHFKAYNDSYGHPAGDDCLASVAGVLANAMRRPGDMAARYGGEEFVLLLPDTEISGARDVASRILADVDRLNIEHRNSSVSEHVTVSIGVAACIPADNLDSRWLLSSADLALYQAKNCGRNGLHVSTETPGASKPDMIPAA